MSGVYRPDLVIRMFPSPEQRSALLRRMGRFRWLYNRGVELWLSLPQRSLADLREFKNKLWFTLRKLRVRNQWLRDDGMQVVADVSSHLMRAVKLSFDRPEPAAKMFRRRKLHRRLPLRRDEVTLERRAAVVAGIGRIELAEPIVADAQLCGYVVVRRDGGKWMFEAKYRDR